MRKDINLPKNPTEQDIIDFHKLNENYKNNFKEEIIKLVTKLKLVTILVQYHAVVIGKIINMIIL